MKKLIVLLLFVFGLAANAQQNVGGFLQFNTGISLTSGDFSSTDIENPAAGFANNGGYLSALFGHKIYKDLGAFVSFSAAANGVNTDAISQSLNLNRPTFTWSSKGDFYSQFGFIFGPHLSHNFKKLAVDARVGLGVLNFASPEISYSGISNVGGGNIEILQKSARSSSLAIGTGVSLKYEVKWSWVLLLNADYVQSNPVFNDVEQKVSVTGMSDEFSTIKFEQSFRSFQVGIGLGYVF